MQPDHESLWEKLDRYYRIGERGGGGVGGRAFGPALAPLHYVLDLTAVGGRTEATLCRRHGVPGLQKEPAVTSVLE